MKTNTFKNGIEPKKIIVVGDRTPRFKPTDKKVMAKVTGRDCTPYHDLNPPVFEDDIIPLKRKGLFWLNAIIRTEFRRF